MVIERRLAVDIGGTFTDVALTVGSELHTAKVLTTSREPATGVLEGVGRTLDEAGCDPSQIDVFIHGTTLATNALIERRGAITALLTTQGVRDSVEMAHENRFEQYDLAMRRPDPLVPRNRRLGIPERLASDGTVLLELDEDAVSAAVTQLKAQGVESLAVGYLHSYRSDRHEVRTRELINELWPEVEVTLSSEVCPEIREYERFSTACANAYVQPLMGQYLRDLDARRRELEMQCPMYLLQSGGGLVTLEEALRFPVRLVESGPAGGALLAAEIARELGVKRALSFDMGGTTAKLCIIADGEPRTSREFEVAREYRFLPGSGLPLRLPVIEMVEIGAGGSSIAHRDQLGRITVGPRSAGSEPGPACYGRSGTEPTVTDADVVLGRILPDRFAGGDLLLDAVAAKNAVHTHIGQPAGLDVTLAAVGIAEVVDENMANAGRVHAIEQGCDITGGTLIAFGGAAPLHAARVAVKLGIKTIVIPNGAGVGSAIGFLRAPASHESVRTRHARLNDLTTAGVAELLGEMHAEASDVVAGAAPGAPTIATGRAFMRYRGQGHEITVDLDLEDLLASADARLSDHVIRKGLESRFVESYRDLYTRDIPGLEVEVLSWLLTVRTVVDTNEEPAATPDPFTANSSSQTPVTDPLSGMATNHAIHDRSDLKPGATLPGPALIIESQTTTVVPAGFTATVTATSHLLLSRTTEVTA